MKMTLKGVRRLSLALRAAGSVLLVLTFWTPPHLHPWVPLLLSLAAFGVSAHLDYRRFRCPHCGYHLGKHMYPLPPTCPHCKRPIHADDEAIDPTKQNASAGE